MKYKQKLIVIIFVLKNTAFSVFKIKNKSKVFFSFIFDFMIVRFVIKKYDRSSTEVYSFKRLSIGWSEVVNFKTIYRKMVKRI